MQAIFTADLKKHADEIVARYETKRASILEVLRLVQDHYGYVSREAELAAAEYLGLPPIDVHEVITFYSLFYQRPKAKTRFHLCRTLSCSLLGGREILSCLEQKLGIKAGEMTADGKFSIDTVECLGACEIAPMMMKNDAEYIGLLNKEKVEQIIKENVVPAKAGI